MNAPPLLDGMEEIESALRVIHMSEVLTEAARTNLRVAIQYLHTAIAIERAARE